SSAGLGSRHLPRRLGILLRRSGGTIARPSERTLLVGRRPCQEAATRCQISDLGKGAVEYDGVHRWLLPSLVGAKNLKETAFPTTQKFFRLEIAGVSHPIREERGRLPLLATTTPQPFAASLWET